MDLTPLFKRLGKVAVKNSPAILTSIGVTGAVASAYLAAKGAFKAADILKEASTEKYLYDSEGNHRPDKSEREMTEEEIAERYLTFEEKFSLTWQCYAPAVGCLVLSATAMICSHRIQDRRAAAMASAYSVVRESYTEYRAKATEKLGPKKEQEVRDEIAQDRRNRHPVETTKMVITGKGLTRCYDKWNDRYFNSSKNTIDAAVNAFNREMINGTYGSLTDFYHLLNVPGTGHSDHIGWTTDQLLELDVSGTLDDEGEPCLQIDFKTLPHDRFDRAF